jgi:hypothetical protein
MRGWITSGLAALVLTMTAGSTVAQGALGDAAEVTPKAGWYEGHDARHLRVIFRLGGSEIYYIRIAEHAYAPAHLRGGRPGWQGTCNDYYCSSGEWTSDTEVDGIRSTTYSQVEIAFHAHWWKP